jgi:hypothetical protein
LEDADDERLRDFANVFSSVAVGGVWLAKLTKIFYKKRPRFVPVIDSKVWTYYKEAYLRSVGRKRFPKKLPLAEQYFFILRLLRGDIRSSRSELESIQNLMANEQKPMTKCRLLSHLI